MRMRSVWAAARAARYRFAAIVVAGGVAAALAGGAGQLAAPASAAAPRDAGAGGYLAATAILADFRGGGGPLAVNPATGSVYVAEPFEKGLSVLSALTGQVSATIALPDHPAGVGVDPATGTVYATYGQAVAVISGQSDQVTATIADTLSPSQIAVDPAAGTVYVTNTGSDTITVIDGSTNAVTTTISTGHLPAAIAADPVTGTIYAASGDGTVSVIDGTTNTVTATISVGAGQDAIAVNPRTDTIYSGSFQAIAVISGSTNTVTATIEDGAAGIAADPRTDTMYITGPGGGTSALNGRTNNLVSEAEPAPAVFPPGQGPEIAAGAQVAVNPAAGTVYSVYSVYEEFGEVSHLQVIGSCASGVRIVPGTGCAKVEAAFKPGAVSFADPAHGVVLGALPCGQPGCAETALMATADGGKNWTFLPQPPGAVGTAPPPSPVLFAGPGDGWLYGALHTTDGGVTWHVEGPVPYGTVPYRFTVAMAATATTIYAAAPLRGYSSLAGLFARPAGGSAWTRIPGITANVTGLAVSGHAAWLTGTTHLWATGDGRHWHRYRARCPGTGYQLAGVTAASPTHVAFLCARPGSSPLSPIAPKEVLTSANGGRTVRLAGPAPAKGTPLGFASPPGNPAVITIVAGTEFSGTLRIYRSANNGRTWTIQKIHTNETLRSLTFTNRTTGWIALSRGVEGTLLHTTDSGRTWHKTTP